MKSHLGIVGILLLTTLYNCQTIEVKEYHSNKVIAEKATPIHQEFNDYIYTSRNKNGELVIRVLPKPIIDTSFDAEYKVYIAR